MKKVYLIILSLSVAIAGFAQEFQNRTETNCYGIQQSAHAILNEGKVLFIVSAGFDCTLCQVTAPQIKAYVDNHKNQMVFWGALSYLYNQTTEPDCAEVLKWEKTHDWTNLFNFADSEILYSQSGLPNYKVINPTDKTLAYDGDDFKKATETADKLALSTGVKDDKKSLDNSLTTTSKDGRINISFNATNPGDMTINLYDITGKEIESKRLNFGPGNNTVTMGNTNSLRNGIYILNMKAGELSLSRKISMY